MSDITTCQICARAIKSKHGLIAHHGYKRPDYGWQTASCFGARYQPYEIACDALPLAIIEVKRFIAAHVEYLKTFRANPPDKLIRQLGYKDKQIEFTKPHAFDPNAADFQYKRMTYHSYENEYNKRVYDHESNIKFGKSDLKRLETRLANWSK
jgi:hypothetical protein